MNRNFLVFCFAAVFVVSVGAAPQYPRPVLDYRAERDYRSLKRTLAEGTGQEFFEELNVFVRRYGYVPALADLYMRWAEKQTRIRDAALLYAEVLRRWPKQPEARKATLALSQVMLLTEPWSLNDSLKTLRGFSQRMIDGDAPLPEAPVMTAIAKVLLKANEPGQARACVIAALSQPQNDENTELELLNAESYRAAGDVEKAADMFYKILDRPVSSRWKQTAAVGFLRCASDTDPRWENAQETLRKTDPDRLTSHY